MELYQKPVMMIVALEEMDILTGSCPLCHSLDYTGFGPHGEGAHIFDTDGCYIDICIGHKLPDVPSPMLPGEPGYPG